MISLFMLSFYLHANTSVEYGDIVPENIPTCATLKVKPPLTRTNQVAHVELHMIVLYLLSVAAYVDVDI